MPELLRYRPNSDRLVLTPDSLQKVDYQNTEVLLKRRRIIKPEELYENNDGIDIRSKRTFRNATRYALQYEDACFDKINSSSASAWSESRTILGPHLIDTIFPGYFTKEGSGIPDALEMNTEDPTEWHVSKLFEFKSGRNYSVGDKLVAFEKLLDHMREEPTALPQLLKTRLPFLEERFPETITIPHVSELKVEFISPYPRSSRYGLVFDKDYPPFKMIEHNHHSHPETFKAA